MAPIKKNQKKKGWLSLTTTTKRSWSKEDHVHQGQYQRKKLKEPCVEEEIIDGLEGSSVQKIIKKKGWLTLTTPTKRRGNKENQVHQG